MWIRVADPRVPDRIRGRAADERDPEKPVGRSRRHNGPCGLPAWFAGVRTRGPAMGPNRVCLGDAPRAPGEAGHAQHASHPRRRIAGDAAAQARTAAKVAFRVLLGARGTLRHRRARPHGRASRERRQACLQGAPPHAQARLRLRTGKRGTIPVPCRAISGTATSSTPCDTLRCRRHALRTSGASSRRCESSVVAQSGHMLFKLGSAATHKYDLGAFSFDGVHTSPHMHFRCVR